MKTRILGVVAVGAMLGATLAETGFAQDQQRAFDKARDTQMQDRRGRGVGAFLRGRRALAQPQRFIARHDDDGDGRISADEFVDTRLETIDRLFARRDTDGDGLISAEEHACPRASFERNDTNGDGTLSLQELSATLEARAHTLFARIDDDGDAYLTEAEVAAQFAEGLNLRRVSRACVQEQSGR